MVLRQISRIVAVACASVVLGCGSVSTLVHAKEAVVHEKYESRMLVGWQLLVSKELIQAKPAKLERTIELLELQLAKIVELLPEKALASIRGVPLWISPEYEGEQPGAQYHPNAGWLRKNGRDVALEKCIEFTNVEHFEAECLRMPMLALHELSHAYHDQVLGFDLKTVRDQYDLAKASGKYDSVQRWRGPNIPLTTEKAYAMTTPQEYFAEGTEAFFGRNDFFPFSNDELKRHDPELHRLLGELWGVADEPEQ